MTHLCKQCGKPIVGSPGESRSRVSARIYCSRQCNTASMKHDLPDRTCPVCAKPILKRERESYFDFMARKSCSAECGRRLQWAKRQNHAPGPIPELPEKFCLHCGKKLVKHPRGESFSNFAKRRFCSHKCSYVYANRASRARWNGAGEKREPIRVTVPAATEAEWLALNGGPTKCPTVYAAPIEHHLHVRMTNGRVR